MSGEKQETAQVPEKMPIPTCAFTEGGMVPETVQDVWWLACRIFGTEICPRGCKSQEEVFLRITTGMEVGLKPLQAVQNICVIHGKPSLYGPARLGVVKASGLVEMHECCFEGELNPDGSFPMNYTAVSRGKRKGQDGIIEIRYDVADATLAGLWGKRGPSGKPSAWVTSPKDMLMHRANSRLCNILWPDAVHGISSAEEVIDAGPDAYQEAEVLESEINPPPNSVNGLAQKLKEGGEGTAERIRREVQPVNDSKDKGVTAADTSPPREEPKKESEEEIPFGPMGGGEDTGQESEEDILF